MAHRSALSSIWTSLLTALVAFLSSLGLGGKAALAGATAPAGDAPAAGVAVSAAGVPVARPAVAARRTWRAMMRGGSLPPTIKQRIRAEAHGKTPSVRRSTTAAAMGAGAGAADRLPTTVGSPVGSPVGVGVGARAVPARGALALAA
ncbi:DUF6344 domain-containing protein [Streptomyces sp. MB09-01]|uniref:DUF6344 domain-containing protein n=1 Tax=Streptomyces sp. MB09-01 TaxID=3028666 RepID=UPI0029B7AF33|nr:DUF6344 domain-containing protein [Streptomyces sp. MB09-01]MDX3535363.1 DUF6344 domain-containing protein [Streptomyces sp. MB09-01]